MSDQTQQAGEAAAATAEGSLLDEILSETKLNPTDEGYDVTRTGIKALMKELLSPKHQNEKVESAWRGLKFVIDHTDFRENIKVELLNVSKQDLMQDFEDSPEIVKSGL